VLLVRNALFMFVFSKSLVMNLVSCPACVNVTHFFLLFIVSLCVLVTLFTDVILHIFIEW
jgi:hypothetical protein